MTKIPTISRTPTRYRHPLPGPAVEESATALLLPGAEAADAFGTKMFDSAVCHFDRRNSYDSGRCYAITPRTPKPSHGFIYAAAYEGVPNLVKVGQSRRYPTRRLAELTTRTAAPSSLQLLFALETPFRHAAEKSAHDTLRHSHSKGEWFKVSPADLQSMMFGIAAIHEWRGYGWRLWVTPEFLGLCSAAEIRHLCLAGLGSSSTACDDDHVSAPMPLVA